VVLQCRVRVIRIKGNVGVRSPMQPGDILFTEKLLFLYIIESQIYIYVVL
jgi:hypothetical protein